MPAKPRYDILLVEDTPALARTYQGFLRGEDYAVRHVETGGEALGILEGWIPAAVLLDLKLPDMDGMEILRWVTARALPCPVIVITAHGSVDTAVAAMRAGASDFLVKPFDGQRLKVTLKNLLEKQELAEMVDAYREEIDRKEFQGFIGSSLAMQAVYRSIESAASSEVPVFITGESGTGKELCAEAVHRLSRRGKGPFIALNCAAIPKDLVESEIFGHVKGAFTGATSERSGAVGLADGGTLFLDEICEMDPQLQSKLLRFVQSGTFMKVGSNKTRQVDVRFVCATNRQPLKEVEAGRFREDLYYRLHVIPIRLPPLRERGDDAVEIARQLLKNYCREEDKRFESLAPETEVLFRDYAWPGNVRELQNVLRHAAVFHDGETVTPDMLPETLRAATARPGNRTSTRGTLERVATTDSPGEARPDRDLGRLAELIRPIDEVERDAIERAIELCGGDVKKAAVFLGISPATVYRKLKHWAGATSE